MSDLTNPPQPTEDLEDSSSSEGSDDQCWDDWVEESADKQPCQSLIGDQQFTSVAAASEHDKSQGLDLHVECTRLGLDGYGRIRLINYIRKHKPSVKEITAFTPSEPFLNSDEYLRPVLEDDPLLLQDGEWSDDSDSEAQTQDPAKKAKILEKKLARLQRDFADYKSFVSNKLNIARLTEALTISDETPNSVSPAPRDDDTHYFQSYGEHDIHAVMIQDKVRTSTYASFILSNPELLQDAIVMDVGCGTGILSLFAARAGAKKVYAIDASDIVEKAEKIVKANRLDDVITVIRGKVENITLPDDVKQVDVIISEWMGYALLYESMLDSVLFARDKFLKPGGTMAPSQCQMMLALCDASEVFKERIGFWDDVYGFDMSVMAENSYGEAIVDVVGAQTLLSEPVVVKDLHLNDITPKQLDFKCSFTLVSTVAKRTKVNSFVLYFDTFFTVDGEPVPEGTRVQEVAEGDGRTVEVWHVGGARRRTSFSPHRRRSSVGVARLQEEKKIASFSTGPRSTPTHWKQTLFLLQNPISVIDGSIVEGQFFCKKSQDNSRELNVELHFSVRESLEAEPGQTIIQMYKVR